MFPKIGVPQNGWFIMENPIKMMIWGYHHFRKTPYVSSQEGRCENCFLFPSPPETSGQDSEVLEDSEVLQAGETPAVVVG